MATQAVMVEELECKSKSWEALNQASIDLLTESVQRLKLISKMLWQVEDLDKVERGTVAIMLSNECDNISKTSEALELHMAEVTHG